MARGIIATNFTGGTTSDLDFTDGSELSDGDIGKVRKNSVAYEYILNASSGATADGVRVIEPNVNAGAKRWELLVSYAQSELFGDYSKTGDHAVLFGEVGCWDDSGVAWISCDDQTVTVPTSINEVYCLFACSDGVIRLDTDEDGANLSSYTKRFIGLVLNDSAGDVVDCHKVVDRLFFAYKSVPILKDIDTTYVEVDPSTILPTSRIKVITYAADHASSNTAINISYDAGSTIEEYYNTTLGANGASWDNPVGRSMHCKSSIASRLVNVYAAAITLRI